MAADLHGGMIRRIAFIVFACSFAGIVPVAAQDGLPCRPFCSPHVNIEPTWTIENLFGGPRLVDADGSTRRARTERVFELVVSMGLPTRWPWLAFTGEAIVQPFSADATPELEFEANVIWLPAERTGGWVSSHVDVVDKFSPAERPTDRRAYTHKLNMELDTAVAIFTRLPEHRYLHAVELEGSLDFVASGLARRGDVIDGARLLDDASAWSFSVVVVLPLTR
jgi:hypothetical protein